MTEDDRQRFQEITGGIGDVTPEAREVEEDLAIRERLRTTIDKLQQEQLGRPIVSTNYGGASAVNETIGYVLPLTPDDKSHLLMFNDGELVVTEPASPHSELHMRDYVNFLSPGETPFTAGGHSPADIKSRVHGTNGVWKATLSNNTMDALPEMHSVIDKALQTAVEKKAVRDKARRESSKYLLDGLDRTVFRQHQQPPGHHHAPPPDNPHTSQQ